MKLLVFILFLSGTAFANLTCVTDNKVSGWVGTDDYITFKALAFQKDQLMMPTLRGAYYVSGELVQKDPTYRNKNPRYNNYDRFILADAWHTFMILLPKNFKHVSFYNRFDGYIQIIRDESPGAQVHKLKCGMH